MRCVYTQKFHVKQFLFKVFYFVIIIIIYSHLLLSSIISF